MSKKVAVRALALAATGVLAVGAIPLTACNNGSRDSIVIMAEEFSGLFNPFYATSGADMEVVGVTQLSMLTTDSKGDLAFGDDQATAVKDFEISDDGSGNSVYTFVLKNGLKFSDGKPLTMNDVMFNIYEYLDPVYTGSSTMYSVKIDGLAKYRTQTDRSGTEATDQMDKDSLLANENADTRRSELVGVYQQEEFRIGGSSSSTYSATRKQMEDAIKKWEFGNSTYKDLVPMEKENPTDDDYRTQLLADYNFVLETFKEELNDDFRAAKESYDLTTAPYAGHDEMKSDVFKFFLFEGRIKPKYGRNPETNKEDRSIIESFENANAYENIKTQEEAVERLFNDMITDNFTDVLLRSATAGDVLTKFAADAKDMILNDRREEGELKYPRVDGIVSLGHKVDGTYVLPNAQESVVVRGTPYKIAYEHNADGTPKIEGTYDILRITIEGKDPKAKYNFSFAVAPAHYYSDQEVNIEENKFGVEYASSSFQSNVVQSLRNVQVPMGAGPYKATNAADSDTPGGLEFRNNNYVYFKANHNFLFPVKTEKMQFLYVSSSNALPMLKSGDIDFATPQFTPENSKTVTDMQKDGFASLDSWQLGYGYVGINAGKVTNLNLRKAIMSAMQATLATEYYTRGTCVVINWPMSNQSWAYPNELPDIEKDYLRFTTPEEATEKIRKYTNAAINEGATKLNYKFTIAGASITEHPTYAVFRQAAQLLNDSGLGWDVEVKADSQALTKLATGSLEVWAAAWGSTIDPDMYQVYHKNSTASSVYAWGYREILAGSEQMYGTEQGIITELSGLIDDAREEEDQTYRKGKYKDAMGLVLDLAVEMPIYQRKNLYAYNANRITGLNPEPNPYTSPLEKIWELEIKA